MVDMDLNKHIPSRCKAKPSAPQSMHIVVQMAHQEAKLKDSFPRDYTIRMLDYPTDLHPMIDAVVAAFANDPNTIYLDKHIKNPLTIKLRAHMREARFRNQIENLNANTDNHANNEKDTPPPPPPPPPRTDTIFAKLIHTPTSTIAGLTSWTFPTKTAIPSSSLSHSPRKPPYPLLPDGISLPAEDALLVTLGPRLEEDLDAYIATIPLLGGSKDSRDKHWWYLALLGVIPLHNGQRLGARMVEWGLGMAREDALLRPDVAIRGAWLTSTEAGLRTYLKVGFQVVGQVRILYGSLDGVGPGWRVVDVTEETMRQEGQMCYVLAMEF